MSQKQTALFDDRFLESFVEKGIISIQSPLGRSILGKEVGDEAKVVTPGGIREFEIMNIAAPEND